MSEYSPLTSWIGKLIKEGRIATEATPAAESAITKGFETSPNVLRELGKINKELAGNPELAKEFLKVKSMFPLKASQPGGLTQMLDAAKHNISKAAEAAQPAIQETEKALRPAISRTPVIERGVGGELKEATTLGPEGSGQFKIDQLSQSKDFTLPTKPGLPTIRSESGLPSVLERDVTPKMSVEPQAIEAPKMSVEPKITEPNPYASTESVMDMSEDVEKAAGKTAEKVADKTVMPDKSFSEKYPRLSKAGSYAKKGALGAIGAGELFKAFSDDEGDHVGPNGLTSTGPMADLTKETQQEQKQVAPAATSIPKARASIGTGTSSGAGISGGVKPEMTLNAKDFETLGTQENLNKAIEARNMMQLFGGIGKETQRLGEAIAQVKPADTSTWEGIAKSGEQITKDYATRVENEKNDPNSGISKLYKGTLEALGIKVEGNPSAAALEKQIPGIEKVLSHREKLAEMRFTAQEREKDRQLAREESGMRRTDTTATKLAQHVSDRISPEALKSSTQVGTDAKNIAGIQNIKALMNGEISLDDLTPQQAFEVSRVFDRVLTGSAATQFGTKHLTNETIKSELADWSQKTLGNPTGAGLGKFLAKTRNTLDREEALANKRLDKYIKKEVGILSNYRNNPDVRAVLLSHELDPDTVFDYTTKKDDRTTKQDKDTGSTNDWKSRAIPTK